MCLGFDLKYLLLMGLGLISLSTQGQNVSSPYSILGIGDVDTKDFGRYASSGSAALSRRDQASINFSNPASLTALPYKTMNFDLVLRGRSSTFRQAGVDTASWPTQDFTVKRISLAFKVNESSAFSFGLKPFSSSNYLYLTDKTLSDNTTGYNKLVQGSGGINQVYGSYARVLGKRFSAGATVSYMFGSLLEDTRYLGQQFPISVTRTTSQLYYGVSGSVGLQYYSLETKKWQHGLGLVASIGSELSGENYLEYFEDTALLKKEVSDKNSFPLPASVGFGYTLSKNSKYYFTVEGNYYHWQRTSLNYNQSYTAPAFRFSAGFEYSNKKVYLDWRDNLRKSLIERSYFGVGINYEKSYMVIKNRPLYDYSFSMGGGLNVSRQLSVYATIESGVKGKLIGDQFRERYTQVVIGLTMKDIWLGPKITRRYR